ncbi:MAG TPA: hypothetical protein VMI73_09965 [Trebonia sp.]|nr:hypothetical protein [Trebonia sp.]
MFVVIVIAALAVVAAAVFAFRGGLGEMSAERNDYVPLDLGPVSATDVALLRPPTSLWGYNVQATDEAMEQIAESIRERDVRIVALEQLVTDLGREHEPMTPLGSPYVGARRRRAPGDGAADTETLRWEGQEQAWRPPEQSWEGQEPSWQGQEPSWQEQPWQDHEPAWEQDQVRPDEVQQGREQPWQEHEQPWQQEHEQEQPWQAPEQTWQAPEPSPSGDNQAPPPERSHD